MVGIRQVGWKSKGEAVAQLSLVIVVVEDRYLYCTLEAQCGPSNEETHRLL